MKELLSGKVRVNGANLDREFFLQQLDDAKEVEWQKADGLKIDDHAHCLICQIAIGEHEAAEAYSSECNHLCKSCHARFIDK